MYPVSAAYKTAIGKPIKERRIRGTVGTVGFNDSNIVTGTLKIDNQCSAGTELEIGSVYIGQMACVFRGINLTGEWMGKVITISEDLRVGEDTWESVPLGIFHVVEALHEETGVYVKAYDVMDHLDRPWTLSSAIGKPWDFLELIRQGTGVAFAQTEQQINALPNGLSDFVLYSENDIQTYRDLLFWVAQLTCTFATATRDGKIILRSYSTEAVDEIDGSARWEGSSFSDYETRYTGVSVTKVDDQSTVYMGLPVDDGLTYNLGSNPFLQTGNVNNALNSILTAISAFAYTPFSVDRCGCPAYDLGDVLTFPDGIGGDRTGCMMSYEYDYHDVYMLDGYGANPAIYGAQSKTDKELAGLMSRTNANQLQYYTYTNAKPFEIRDEYKEIISIRFGSTKQTLVTFQAEIALENEIEDQDVDSIINNIKYLLNNVEQEYKPVETWMEGKHLLHLLYLIPIGDAALNTLKVRMNSLGGVTYVLRGNLNAVISGQGLVATDKWDGYIDAEDNIIYVDFGTSGMMAEPITEEAEVALADVIRIDIDESIEEAALDTTPKPMAVDGVVYINKKPIVLLTWGAVKDMEWSADGITDGEDTYSW
ncbi:MAG: hypothetical protein IKG25_05475 [Mogibacterium sp.]|nr:hypothetical protein [Mogibacterium sp.]